MGMRKFLLIATILFSLISNGQTPLHKLIRKQVAAPATSDSVMWNFSETNQVFSPARNLYGEPHSGIRTNAAPNGWTISTVATANWTNYSTYGSAVDNVGTSTNQSVFPEVSSNVLRHTYFMYGNLSDTYDAGKPQFQISGLNPATTYRVWMLGSLGPSAFDANLTDYHIEGLTTPAKQSINGTLNTVTVAAVWDIQPNASGIIKLWASSSTTSVVSTIGVIKIKSL